VFGLSFGELLVLIIVGVVVIGPKELPKMLRKLGQWSGRLRRLAYEMREKSGIDDVLRTEGIDRDIAEIRKLARGELDGVVAATREATRIDPLPRPTSTSSTSTSTSTTTPPSPSTPTTNGNAPEIVVEREREFPREGADSYRALPDTAVVYAETLPASPLADDPLWSRGEDAPRTEPSAAATATAPALGRASESAP
jgi:sec-independent protein translocase protein TatB